MKYSELSELLIKLTGLIVIISTFTNLPVYLSNYYAVQNFYGNNITDMSVFILAIVIPMVVILSLGIFLFVFPEKISDRLFLGDSEFEKDWQFLNPLNLSFIMGIGLYVLTYAIADLIYWITYMYLIRSTTFANDEFLMLDNYSKIIATIFEIIISAMILFFVKNKLK